MFYLTTLVVSWCLVGLPRLRIWVVLLASLYFYASNNSWLLFLLLGTTQVDFVAAQFIEDAQNQRHKKLFLCLSLTINLLVLGFFKYCNFFAATLVAIADAAGIQLGWTTLHIFLPVGISFYTFESMSYVIDVYQGKIKALRSWYRYSFFVAYFPHLIAGPIIRPVDFLPQIDRRASLKHADFEYGLMLIFRGLLKKIVLGDFLATYAIAAFDKPTDAFTALLGVYSFTFEIYFDFSGYSDIAIGCSRLEGFWLPENFNRPYVAQSITEFWRRWHISLSNWLRDYLYIPLGGGRMSKAGVYRNLMITMTLGGLWHGAAWHFVLWGAFQGVLLVIERQLGVKSPAPGVKTPLCLGRLCRILVTFHLVCFSWILFRSESIPRIGEFLLAFTRLSAAPVIEWGMLLAFAICLAGGVTQLLDEQHGLEERFLKLPVPIKVAFYVAVSALVTVLGGVTVPFIYFQF